MITLILFSLFLSGIDSLNVSESNETFWEKAEDVLVDKFYGKPKTPLKDVKFYLFNRKEITGSDEYSIYNPLNISSIFKNFNPSTKTKIIVHGWKGSLNSRFNNALRKAYLPLYDYNIIIVDWSEAGAQWHPYFSAARQVPRAAQQLGLFIDRLCSEFQLRPEELHVIGHSLGAHVAGLSGKSITIGKIGRVTGLDPARPSFRFKQADKRISTDSGLFVDIIHTCGGYLGTPYQIGHADFFPNSGRWMQPGCGLIKDIKGSCSHMRSFRYYAESILNPTAFLSTHCLEWAVYKANECGETFAKVNMGEFTPKWASGSYYLYTNKEPPYNKL